MRRAFFKLITVFALFFFMSAFAFANLQQTTMTWYVPSAKSHSVAYGGSCSTTAFFFAEPNALHDNDTDGNAAKIIPYNQRDSGSACQSVAIAGMTITNTGTVTTNIDANFAAGIDTNIWLKIWMGTGSGCGTDGMGGWSKNCALAAPADTTSPITQAICRDFNTTNSTLGARLVSTLAATDSNQLCFSGEFVGPVITETSHVLGGDHNATFQTSTDFS